VAGTLDDEYEVGLPVAEFAAGQLEAGGVTFACAAPVRFGGNSFGSAMLGSKRLPARTELTESPLVLAAATAGRAMRGLPAG